MCVMSLMLIFNICDYSSKQEIFSDVRGGQPRMKHSWKYVGGVSTPNELQVECEKYVGAVSTANEFQIKG